MVTSRTNSVVGNGGGSGRESGWRSESIEQERIDTLGNTVRAGLVGQVGGMVNSIGGATSQNGVRDRVLTTIHSSTHSNATSSLTSPEPHRLENDFPREDRCYEGVQQEEHEYDDENGEIKEGGDDNNAVFAAITPRSDSGGGGTVAKRSKKGESYVDWSNSQVGTATIADNKRSVQRYVRETLFAKVKFITCDEELEYTGK